MFVAQENNQCEKIINENKFFENLYQALLADNRKEAKKLFEIYKSKQTDFKNSPLHYYATRNYFAIINKLSSLNVDIHELNSEGKTALLIALENGYLTFANNLIKHLGFVSLLQEEINLIVELFFQGRKTIFVTCLEKGLTALLSIQFTHNNIKRNLLHYALYSNCLHLVPTLLEYDMNVDEVDSTGNSALHYAANSIFLEIDLFKKIMAQSSNINLANRQGESPIYLALNAGREDFASLLLEQKAAVNLHASISYHLLDQKYRNIGSATPIHYCVILNKLHLLKLFKDTDTRYSNTTKHLPYFNQCGLC